MTFKAISIFLILLMAIGNITTVFAREEPPGPGSFVWLFGGTVYYNRAGHTLGVSIKQPFEIDPDQKIWIYNPNEPVKLHPCSIVRFDFMAESGRRINEENKKKYHTEVRVSDKQLNDLVLITSFDGHFQHFEYQIPRYNTGYIFFHFRTNAEGKDQDQYTGLPLWVEPNPIRSTTQMGTPPVPTTPSTLAGQQPMDYDAGRSVPAPEKTGTIKINFFERLRPAIPVRSQEVLVPQFTIYSNEKEVVTKTNLPSNWSVDGVPGGIITLNLSPCNWDLDPRGGWFLNEKTGKYSWNLEPGQTLIINLQKKGGQRR